jgi:OmpA-OmpF porin, OOP family
MQLRRIHIEGHSETRGSKLVNLELSEERAHAVRDYLVECGIDSDRLLAIGYGPLKPIAEGNDEDAHAFNRRVEFWVEERDELPQP